MPRSPVDSSISYALTNANIGVTHIPIKKATIYIRKSLVPLLSQPLTPKATGEWLALTCILIQCFNLKHHLHFEPEKGLLPLRKVCCWLLRAPVVARPRGPSPEVAKPPGLDLEVI